MTWHRSETCSPLVWSSSLGGGAHSGRMTDLGRKRSMPTTLFRGLGPVRMGWHAEHVARRRRLGRSCTRHRRSRISDGNQGRIYPTQFPAARYLGAGHGRRWWHGRHGFLIRFHVVRNTKAPQRCGAFFCRGFSVIAFGFCRRKQCRNKQPVLPALQGRATEQVIS